MEERPIFRMLYHSILYKLFEQSYVKFKLFCGGKLLEAFPPSQKSEKKTFGGGGVQAKYQCFF